MLSSAKLAVTGVGGVLYLDIVGWLRIVGGVLYLDIGRPA